MKSVKDRESSKKARPALSTSPHFFPFPFEIKIAPVLLSIEIVGAHRHVPVQIFLIPAARVQGDTAIQQAKPKFPFRALWAFLLQM
jgi:hypothetical protein